MPYEIQKFIVCEFLFEDILVRTGFKPFFKTGNDFDSRFAFECALGLIPRQFLDDPFDRYIYEEEGDVTEINFIMKGEWCVAFESFSKDEQLHLLLHSNKGLVGTEDMV